jgi:hypothetical protein
VKRNFRELYALAACFASMIVVVVSVSMALFDALRIAAPSVTVSGYTYQQSMSDDAFLQGWPRDRPRPDPPTISGLRREAFENAIRSERHEGLSSFLQSLMYTIAAGLAFGLHWSLAKREQTTPAGSPA